MRVRLIPARAGSERIPDKNTKTFNGKPIIGWTLEMMLESGLFDRVIVSTDSEDIAHVAREFKAETPFLRPAELADNQTALMPVIQHTIAWLDDNYIKSTHLCCVLATSALLKADDLQRAYTALIEERASYSFSVARYGHPIQRSLRIHNKRVEVVHPEFRQTRTQDLEPRYHDAGQFYWGTREAFVRGDPVFSECSVPVPLPSHLALDIDTPDDWQHAELIHRALLLQNNA